MTQQTTTTRAKPQTTPVGIVTGWVSILEPDTKYDEDGVYKINLAFNNTDPAIKKIISEIDAANDRVRKEFEANRKGRGGRPIAQANLPYYEQDHLVILSFKAKATIRSKRTGQQYEKVIPVFGAGNTRIPPDQLPTFAAGSTARVSFTMNPFANAAIGSGVSLRLEAVKLITVKLWSGDDAAGDAFNDSEDEDGYSVAGSPDADADGGPSGEPIPNDAKPDDTADTDIHDDDTPF